MGDDGLLRRAAGPDRPCVTATCGSGDNRGVRAVTRGQPSSASRCSTSCRAVAPSRLRTTSTSSAVHGGPS